MSDNINSSGNSENPDSTDQAANGTESPDEPMEHVDEYDDVFLSDEEMEVDSHVDQLNGAVEPTNGVMESMLAAEKAVNGVNRGVSEESDAGLLCNDLEIVAKEELKEQDVLQQVVAAVAALSNNGGARGGGRIANLPVNGDPNGNHAFGGGENGENSGENSGDSGGSTPRQENLDQSLRQAHSVLDSNPSEFPTDENTNSRSRKQDRLLIDIPKPKIRRAFGNLDTGDDFFEETEITTDSLLAEAGCFIRNNNNSSRPRANRLRQRSRSPSPHPPHAPYIDSDYEFAKRLQEEEDRLARNEYNPSSTSHQSSSSSIFPQQSLNPGYEENVEMVEIDEDSEELIQIATLLYQQCKEGFPHVSFPEPFQVGFTTQQLCQGYEEVLSGRNFPYSKMEVPRDPPGSPTAPEQACVPQSSAPFRIIAKPPQERPNRLAPFKKLGFTEKLQVQRLFDGPSCSSSSRPPAYDDDSQPGPSNRRRPRIEYDDGTQPGPSSRRARIDDDDDDNVPGPSHRRSRFNFDDTQPGPSNRRRPRYDENENESGPAHRRSRREAYSQVPDSSNRELFTIDEYDNNGDEVQKALNEARQRHKEKMKQEEEEYARANPSENRPPLKERIVALHILFNKPKPETHRPPMETFLALEKLLDVNQTQVPLTADNWPTIKWLDPENMPPLTTIPSSERMKMPRSYKALIVAEERLKPANPEPAEPTLQTFVDIELADEKEALEKEFTAIAHLIAPCEIPDIVANTRFEIYIRFPFLGRPRFVRDVLDALHIEDNKSADVPEEEDQLLEIRMMRPVEFLKYAVYTRVGLTLNGATNPNRVFTYNKATDPDILQMGRDTLYGAVKGRFAGLRFIKSGAEDDRKRSEKFEVYLYCLKSTSINRDDVWELKSYDPRGVPGKYDKDFAAYMGDEAILAEDEDEDEMVQKDQNDVTMTEHVDPKDGSAVVIKENGDAKVSNQEPNSDVPMTDAKDPSSDKPIEAAEIGTQDPSSEAMKTVDSKVQCNGVNGIGGKANGLVADQVESAEIAKDSSLTADKDKPAEVVAQEPISDVQMTEDGDAKDPSADQDEPADVVAHGPNSDVPMADAGDATDPAANKVEPVKDAKDSSPTADKVDSVATQEPISAVPLTESGGEMDPNAPAAHKMDAQAPTVDVPKTETGDTKDPSADKPIEAAEAVAQKPTTDAPITKAEDVLDQSSNKVEATKIGIQDSTSDAMKAEHNVYAEAAEPNLPESSAADGTMENGDI